MNPTRDARVPFQSSLGRSLGWSFGWALCLALVACGGGKKDKGDKKDISKAFDNTSQIDTKANEKAMKAVAEKAENERKQAREDELQKITTVAPPLPVDVATACADAGAAFDEFKTKRLAAGDDQDMLGRWNATKEPDVRKFVENCTAIGKLEIGACLASAHRNASMAMFGEAATDDFAARCTERYGGGEAKTPTPTP